MAEQCKNCGAELFTAQKFCRECGTPTSWEAEEAPTQMMSPPDGWTQGSAGTSPTNQAETTPVYAPPSYYTPSVPPPAPTMYQQPPMPAYPPPPPPARSRSPWIIVVVLIAVLFFGGAIYGGRRLIQKAREFITQMTRSSEIVTTETVPINKGAAISIASINGSVSIEVWNQPQAEIRITRRGRAQEVLRDVPVRVDSTNPDNLIVDASDLPSNVSVSFRIRVPRELGQVKINLTNGSINISDISGIIEAETSNGSITIDNVSGLAKAATSNGSIKADIKNLAPDQPIVFNASNGSIDLDFQSPINVNLDATTGRGSIRIDDDFGIKVQRSGPSNSASGQIGTGGQKMTVSTGNGSIRISK